MPGCAGVGVTTSWASRCAGWSRARLRSRSRAAASCRSRSGRAGPTRSTPARCRPTTGDARSRWLPLVEGFTGAGRPPLEARALPRTHAAVVGGCAQCLLPAQLDESTEEREAERVLVVGAPGGGANVVHQLVERGLDRGSVDGDVPRVVDRRRSPRGLRTPVDDDDAVAGYAEVANLQVAVQEGGVEVRERCGQGPGGLED